MHIFRNLSGGGMSMGNETGRVYIVDDDPVVCDSISCVLDSVGYSVAAYHTAEAFLANGPDTNPHCLIVDLILPGMSGMRLCRELSQHKSVCAFIVVTGN